MLPGYAALSEREWIRTHLSLVEGILSNRNTDHLSSAQKHNRAKCLSLLHGYWLSGNFPVNEDYATRTPIFIDKYDNFCAVGYLVKATGNEQVSRMIAAKTNLAYVKEMNYPELTAWAADNGFTVDELAWIQPGYEPTAYCFSQNVGNGVNGHVNELFVDNTTGRMYVGGKFGQVDGAITANNIAYITTVSDSVYTWHTLGAGISGTVHAIAKYDNKIFAGGSFDSAGAAPASNIAFWDGSSWHAAGCINGTVYDLVVFDDMLFASGDFDSCITGGEVNFAKWTGSMWEPIVGLSGKINTMEPTASALVLGGTFNYGSTPLNAIRWSATTSFQTFTNGINNEVMDFETYQDTLYAVCRRTHATDTNSLFLLLRGNTWFSGEKFSFSLQDFSDSTNALSLNTLCSEPSSLNFGGQFEYHTPIVPPYYYSPYSKNCFSFSNYAQSVDSAVNKMAWFNNGLFIGGNFKTGHASGGSIALNGIAKRKIVPASIPITTAINGSIRIYPNPATNNSMLHLENNFNASRYTLHHITGKLYAAGVLDKTQQITLGSLSAGIYIIALTNDAGERVMQKIVVQ